MSNSQRYLIKKYFNSLVKRFIKDSKHRDIKIIFQDFSDSRIQGQTRKKNEPIKKEKLFPKIMLTKSNF